MATDVERIKAEITEACSGRMILPDGRIAGPGKFEGETAATLYYWRTLLEGGADSEGADGIARFRVSREERAAFVALYGESMRLGRWFRIREDDNGFVYGW